MDDIPLVEPLKIVDAVINAVEGQDLSDEDLYRLQHVLPEETIIDALDLIDRTSVIKYTTDWGHTEYEVIGSNGTYLVLLAVSTTGYPYFCSCPGFMHYVLQQKCNLMCKHLLAARLADRMSLCVERKMKPDDLATLYMRQFSLPEKDSERDVVQLPL